MWKLVFTFAAGIVTGVLLDQLVEEETNQWNLYNPEEETEVK